MNTSQKAAQASNVGGEEVESRTDKEVVDGASRASFAASVRLA